MSCPDDNVLTAMVEQALEPAQLHALEVHIDSCRRCRTVVAALAGSTALGTPLAPAEGEHEPLAPIAGASINERYWIEAVLGRGGMGTVYLARDRSLGREVALKLHRAGSGSDRLHREAIAMAKLAHPNVVTVFEVATVDDRLYVAMEYVRGKTLRGWLASAPRSWRAIVELLRHAGEGLAAAHAAGLVHRDFKPENVLVGEDGRPRVSDFGLARVDRAPSIVEPLADGCSIDTPMTVTGALMGTPAYMAPEQLDGGTADERSDQFAFCVVAWESLFGHRPFVGGTLAALALAIERQELQRPARPGVPPRVRDVIERGLAVDPAARHADMRGLLGALATAVAPRTHRRAALGVAGAGVISAAVVVAMAWSGRDHGSTCEVGDAALAGVWDRALKDKVRAAFAAARLEDSARTFERVDDVFDRYAGSWIAMRRAACEATRTRGDQSESLLDLRMRCLDRKRDELRAVTHGLADADRPAALSAMRAALGLSAVAECADLAALTSPTPLPTLQASGRVDALRSELATVRGLRLLGRNGPALDKATAIAAQSKTLGYRPVEAEALLVLGDLKDRAGDTTAAIGLLEQAVVAAEAGNHRLVAAQAWSTLAWILGYEDRQFERAEWAIQMAGAAIENLGGNDELSAQLTNYEALILETRGHLAAARTKYLAALAARERMGHHDRWEISIVLNDLGSVERKLGAYDAAQRYHERALDIRQRVFGDKHPYVFSSQINLGSVAWSRRDYPRAEAYFRAAIAIARDVFPANHPQAAVAQLNLGAALERQGKLREAVDADRRALAIYEATRGPAHPDVADALRNLGTALDHLDRKDEARRAFERALAILDHTPDDPALARVLYDLGDLLVRQHDYRTAGVLLQRSVAIATTARSDDPELGYALTALGELFATTGRVTEAGPMLERALVLRTSALVPPEDRARTELALAKLLWRSPADRQRALELGRAARHHLEQAGAPRRDASQDLAQWLAAPLLPR